MHVPSDWSETVYLEEVSRVVLWRLDDGYLVAHDGLEGRLQGGAPVLVVDVEARQVAGLGRPPVAVGQRTL